MLKARKHLIIVKKDIQIPHNIYNKISIYLVKYLVKSIITALAESHQFEQHFFQGFPLRDDCFDFGIDFVEISAELMQVCFELLYLFLLGSIHFHELLYLLGLVDCLSIGCDALKLRVKATY